MTRRGLMQSFVLSTSILLGLCVPPSHPSPAHGWMRTVSLSISGCNTVRAVQCTAYFTTSGFTALTVYELSSDDNSNDTRLAIFMFSSKKCETFGIHPASCVIREEDQTVTLTVVPIDLKQGETRRYRCDAGFYDTSLRTYTFYANLTLPSEPTTPVTVTHTTSAGSNDHTTHRDASESPVVEELAFSKVSTTDGKSLAQTTQTEAPVISAAQDTDSSTTKPVERKFFDVVNIAIGAGVSFAFTVCAVIMWMCRRRCRRPKTPNRRRLVTDESDQEQRPGLYPPEMVVSYQPAAEDYNDLAMLRETPLCARAERPLPSRPISADGDYQELPDRASAAASDAQFDGPYADVKDDVLLLEKDEEKLTEDDINDTKSPSGGHLKMSTEEQKTSPVNDTKSPSDGHLELSTEEQKTSPASESGAENDYVPIRDVVERKRRAEEDKAKRATVV